MAAKKCTGIVLAGGKSSRMGSDKGLILWKGKPLVEHAIDKMTTLCQDIVISSNSHQYDSFHYPVIYDQFKDCGPMGGILSCLDVSKTDLNLIIPVDVPYITPEIYLRLIEHDRDYDIILPLDHESWYQPLCSVINKSIIPAMEEQIRNGVLGFTPLINKVKSKEVPFCLHEDHYQKKTFFNVNSPADLEAIL